MIVILLVGAGAATMMMIMVVVVSGATDDSFEVRVLPGHLERVQGFVEDGARFGGSAGAPT